MQLKRPLVARPYSLAAQTKLCKVAKPDDEFFQAIAKGAAGDEAIDYWCEFSADS